MTEEHDANPATGPDAPTLEDRISYRFSLIAARMHQALAASHRQRSGLSTTAWWVLSVIGRFGPIAGKTVVERTALDQFKVSRITDQLARKRWIRRRTDPADRRRVLLSLTPTGEKIHAEIEAEIRRIEAEVTAVLSPAERATLRGVLERLDESARRIGATPAVRDAAE